MLPIGQSIGHFITAKNCYGIQVTPQIELISRAVIAADGWLLLVRKKGESYSFLPGGHVDFGEPAETALARELQEELGTAANVGRFLGAVENCFTNASGQFHELNLIFAANLPDVAGTTAVASREPHLDFLWQPTARLAD
ncbi:MAG: NUDIX domain-containing protein, partial [Armatimonadota bacterium]